MKSKLVLLLYCVAAYCRALAFTPAPLNVSPNDAMSGYSLIEAFPPLRFEQPVAVVSAPGETNRVFVLERRGIVWAVTNLSIPQASIFLDLRGSTLWDLPYNECGLLGMAFHPGFATNGFVYVYRTWWIWGDYLKDMLSRFQVSADGTFADPSTESVLFAQEDSAINHNAGALRFGPDGYLYFSIGSDGPVAEVTTGLLQSLENGMYGGIFRIDVDSRPENLDPNPSAAVTPGAYKIPKDNPWVGATNFLGQAVDPGRVRTEYYAIGLRNPWQFSVDPLSGEVLCGDVGEQTVEEVNLIKPGGNYGWPYFEGPYRHNSDVSADEFTPPIYQYSHGMFTNTGSAVIGGLAIHNDNYPGLKGAYVFGDFGSGNIRILRREPNVSVEWIAREPGLASFASDPANGDLLVVNVGQGAIRRLVYDSPGAANLPRYLSQTGIFTNLETLSIAKGYEPYEINVSFWSDGARKKRWFGLTDGNSRYGFVKDAPWILPKGAVWVKHFDLDMVKGDIATARRIETRVLLKDSDNIYGYTYRWGANSNDAELVPTEGMDEVFHIADGGQTRDQIWHYPGRGECQACHSATAGFAAGFNTFQLNCNATHDGVSKNELSRLSDLGYLEGETFNPSELQKLSAPNDETQPLEHRVKSFLAANCAMCHHPGGLPIKARWDGRLTTPMESANIIDGPLSQPFADGALDRVVRWRNVTNSVLVQRMLNFDAWTYHMPPFATTVVNDEAIRMLSDWVNALPDPAWSRQQIGGSPLLGSMAEKDGSLIVSGSGGGVMASSESEYFAQRSFSNTVQIVARLKSVPGGTSGLAAGLMMRSDLNTNALVAALLEDETGKNKFIARASSNGSALEREGQQAGAYPWLRMVREGQSVSSWESVDGQSWVALGAAPISLDGNIFAGVSVSSGDSWNFATVEFDKFSALSVGIKAMATNYSLPTEIPLGAEVSQVGESIQRVEFWSNEVLIGSSESSPWTIDWTNAPPGQFELRAVAISGSGLALTSAPVSVSLTAPPSAAWFMGRQGAQSPFWRGEFGSLGYAIPTLVTNLPEGAGLETDGKAQWWTRDEPPYGLDDLGGGVVASSWLSPLELSATFNPATEAPYSFTLFFSDYLAEDAALEVSVVAGESGQMLDSRTLDDFAMGEYLTWEARGKIEIRIHATNGGEASLSGFFVDAAPQSSLTLVFPSDGDVVTLPDSIRLRAEASVEGAPLQRVDFYSELGWIGAATNAPYEFIWTNAIAGNHVVTATALGFFGEKFSTSALNIRCDLPTASATFVGIEGNAQGYWFRAFGAEGFEMPLGPAQMPVWGRATVDASFVGTYDWLPSSDDPRAMRQLDQNSYFATCWYSSYELDATVEFLDGRDHRLSLYFLDFERVGDIEYLYLYDADTNALLDSRPVDDFGEGIYFTWTVHGRVKLRVQRRTAWTAVLSGIFIGGPISHAQFWWADHFGGDLLATANWHDDPDRDGRPNVLEYALGTDPLTADGPLTIETSSDGANLWINVPASQVTGDVAVSVEGSNDLVHWQEANATRDDESQIRFRASIAEAGSQFFRLKFTLP